MKMRTLLLFTPMMLGWLLVGVADRAEAMEPIRISEDKHHFVKAGSGAHFVPWGFNYDRDYKGRLLEDYWYEEFETVLEDLRYMTELGGNAVRIHLQVAPFMNGAEEPNPTALAQLEKLLDAAQEIGIYVNLTGLGCYHKEDVPAWYDALDEAERWAVQARFWEAIAGVAAGNPAVFCYDLMNEPIIGGAGDEGWLAGEPLGGKYFVQRITLEPGERSREEIAEAWVKTLTTAIRSQDPDTLITVGVIPWARVFPGAQPLFYSPAVREHLDFASVHFYPEPDALEEELAALAVYDVGMPLVIEEYFPLRTGIEEMEAFMDAARDQGSVDGWFSFYWGETIDMLDNKEDKGIADAITRNWFQFLRDKGPGMKAGDVE